MLIDMHTHSSEGSSCSDISLEDTIKILIEKGFDGILVTDHESDAGYRQYSMKAPINLNFQVLRGFEVMTKFGDMLIILPIDATILDVDGVIDQCIHPLDLIERVHERKGVIGIPHMFRERYSCIGTSINSEEDLEAIIEAVDFIEVQNGDASTEANRKAEEIADKYKKVKTKGSDSHSSKEVGRFGTVFSVQIKSEVDLITAIKLNLVDGKA